MTTTIPAFTLANRISSCVIRLKINFKYTIVFVTCWVLSIRALNRDIRIEGAYRKSAFKCRANQEFGARIAYSILSTYN
jgi:hypothetical protein